MINHQLPDLHELKGIKTKIISVNFPNIFLNKCFFTKYKGKVDFFKEDNILAQSKQINVKIV